MEKKEEQQQQIPTGRQPKEQATVAATTKTEADPYGMTTKRTNQKEQAKRTSQKDKQTEHSKRTNEKNERRQETIVERIMT
ncbi:hypothetical protein [Tunturiibacter gelidiferens]|uniref:Uncharacterized protein n=1 Tax=Tunturiibacter gelidiferens TaxID=3069689 RepID=A0AAU7Z574_9BACT